MFIDITENLKILLIWVSSLGTSSCLAEEVKLFLAPGLFGVFGNRITLVGSSEPKMLISCLYLSLMGLVLRKTDLELGLATSLVKERQLWPGQSVEGHSSRPTGLMVLYPICPQRHQTLQTLPVPRALVLSSLCHQTAPFLSLPFACQLALVFALRPVHLVSRKFWSPVFLLLLPAPKSCFFLVVVV